MKYGWYLASIYPKGLTNLVQAETEDELSYVIGEMKELLYEAYGFGSIRVVGTGIMNVHHPNSPLKIDGFVFHGRLAVPYLVVAWARVDLLKGMRVWQPADELVMQPFDQVTDADEFIKRLFSSPIEFMIACDEPLVRVAFPSPRIQVEMPVAVIYGG